MAALKDAELKKEAVEIVKLFRSMNDKNNSSHIKRRHALKARLVSLGAVDELHDIKEYLHIRFLAKRSTGKVKKRAIRKLEELIDVFIRSNDLKTLSSIAKTGRMTFAYKALDHMYLVKAENFLIENVIRCCYFTNRPRMGFRALNLLESMLNNLIESRNIPAISFIALLGKKKRKDAVEALSRMRKFNTVEYISNAYKMMANFPMQTQKGRLSFMAHLLAVTIKERLPNVAAERSNAVVGLEMNTIPFIEPIAKELNMQSTIMRNTDPAAKKWRLDSNLLTKKPKKLIIVDDVVTTGTALKAAVSATHKTSHRICNIVVFVNLSGLKKIYGVPILSILG